MFVNISDRDVNKQVNKPAKRQRRQPVRVQANSQLTYDATPATHATRKLQQLGKNSANPAACNIHYTYTYKINTYTYIII